MPLTERVARLERGLEGCSARDVSRVAERAGIDSSLLVAGLEVRAEVGRINDLIHAVSILLALPHLLHKGEKIIQRPSLAAGNDPSRPFDVETDQRIAEFKLSQWTGSDAMRKRQTFKDLANLAMDESGRRPELYVVGPRPISFLRKSKSTAGWALDRHPAPRRMFEKRYSTLDIAVHVFTGTHAAHVELVDLTERLPSLFGELS